MQDLGRIDWRPRSHKWHVIGYTLRFGEIKLGSYDLYDDAFACLRAWVTDGRKRYLTKHAIA